MEKIDLDNKLELHSQFMETISDMKSKEIMLPHNPTIEEFDVSFYSFPPDGKLVTNIEEIKRYPLDEKNGQLQMNKYDIFSYDESILKYSALQGEAYFTSHSIIHLSEDDYIPSCLLTLYFYTRSKDIHENSSSIRRTDNAARSSKKDYFIDRTKFLKRSVKPNSLLLIDGPLIGGDHYVEMIQHINDFVIKDIILVFFVKNSNSNLVTDNIKELKLKFNSDMHWAYSLLKTGERTNLFKYVDKNNKDNAKIFCYLKAFNLSPQRIEIPIEVYKKHENEIQDIIDVIYYLLICHGDLSNPQIRPIAISEKYAKATLSLIDINRIIRESILIPTMNQERFGW